MLVDLPFGDDCRITDAWPAEIEESILTCFTSDIIHAPKFLREIFSWSNGVAEMELNQWLVKEIHGLAVQVRRMPDGRKLVTYLA